MEKVFGEEGECWAGAAGMGDWRVRWACCPALPPHAARTRTAGAAQPVGGSSSRRPLATPESGGSSKGGSRHNSPHHAPARSSWRPTPHIKPSLDPAGSSTPGRSLTRARQLQLAPHGDVDVLAPHRPVVGQLQEALVQVLRLGGGGERGEMCTG